MLDIIFCSIPYRDLDQIYSAPAILKGVVKAHGYSAQTKDFGIDLLEICDRNTELFNRVQNYFISPNNPLSSDEQTILDKFYQHIVEYFKNTPTKYIGISIFSIFTHKSTLEITKLLKDNGIESKIVVGGRGAKVPINISAQSVINVNSIDKMSEFGYLLKRKGLVDHVIIGDGEDAILEILNGTVSESSYRSETFNYPMPDYSDYDFEKYLWGDGQKMFPITGSKGCVRDCDFCDVKFQFGKYRYRTGKDIAEEMIYVANTLGFRKFQFTDSLVNGGLKPFEEFCTIIAQYNEQHPDKKITWNGQYICRPPRDMPDRLYPIMAKSGAHGLTIGAESGSNNVLKHMNKKTSNEALHYELSKFEEYGITCVLLTFVGHWGETHENFIEHCQMIVDVVPHVRSGIISAISLGYTAAMLEGTPAMETSDQQGIIMSDINRDLIWYSKQNPTNTFKERILRRLILHKLVKKLQIPITDEWTFLNVTNNIVKNHYEGINKFYESIL